MPELKHLDRTPHVKRKNRRFYPHHRRGRMSGWFLYFSVSLMFVFIVVPATAGSRDAGSRNVPTGFEVKYVHSGSVYIDAGRRSGLQIGQTLTILRIPVEGKSGNPEKVGEIEIESIASISAVGKILNKKSEILPGDIAYLIPPASISSPAPRETENTPVPKKPVKENAPKHVPRNVNRIRGRIGIDYSTLRIPESDTSSSQFGFVLRLDASRIAGTHWNIRGYHRGRFQSRTNSRGEETLNDLINRTYQLNLTYENPDSNWAFGGGRLYLPYAGSLGTMDGFYLGRKFSNQTAGLFFGTAPDPTSWNFDPDRRTGGVFYNIEAGNFDSVRFDSTSGVALSWIHWRPDRRFGFFENNLYYKHYLSLYSNVEADLLTGGLNNDRSEVVLSRSYLTARLQPHKMVSFHVNHSYFRNIPTFDTQLIGTGLLDRYLFQGVSGGFRLSLPYSLELHANLGHSSRTGDRKASWNYLAGASVSDILNSGIRLGFRFSRFDGSFGQGTYKTLILSRELGEHFQFELQGGQQDFKSVFTNRDRARFVNGSADWHIGNQYFLGGGVTVYRGYVQDYNQFFLRLGYLFDNRRRR
jgi:hypothetical protein